VGGDRPPRPSKEGDLVHPWPPTFKQKPAQFGKITCSTERLGVDVKEQ